MIIIGRKGLYEDWLKPDALLQIEGWARDGLTNDQIAHNMGVGGRTFAEWLVRFPAISASLKKGKAPVDIQVENALLKRALGYDIKETVTELVDSGNGKQRKQVREVTKHIPGDTTAQIFWLKNRRPDKWRDRQETSVGLDVEDLSPLVELLKDE